MKQLLSLILTAAILIAALACGGISAAAEDDPEPAQALHVPQIRIVTAEGNGTTLQKADGYVDATVEITDTDGSVTTGSVSFKVRGNGTALEKILKKAYTFKFPSKRDVLGLGKGKKWALLANAMDVTLLRSYVAFDFAQNLGIRYTSEQKMVEVWVDGSFRGLYILTEPVQEGKDRVNIDIDSNMGMKDFLIQREIARKEDGVSYIKVGGIRFAVNEPEEPNEQQLAYINRVMTNIVNTIKTGTEDAIREVIDVESFAKFYILNEYVKTVDFDYSSVFFYYQDGKLCAGPPWDYDHSMGDNGEVNATYREANKTEDVYAGTKHLYQFLCRYEWFMDEVRSVYAANRAYIANIAADGGLIDTLATEYSAEISRNYSTAGWSVKKQWSVYQLKPLPTYQENLDYLKAWCQARFTWLDDYLTEEEELPSYLLGDANLSGAIDIMDATAIQRTLAGLPTTAYDAAAADCDENGSVSILDATAIQRYLAALPIDYPIGEPRYYS